MCLCVFTCHFQIESFVIVSEQEFVYVSRFLCNHVHEISNVYDRLPVTVPKCGYHIEKYACTVQEHMSKLQALV